MAEGTCRVPHMIDVAPVAAFRAIAVRFTVFPPMTAVGRGSSVADVAVARSR